MEHKYLWQGSKLVSEYYDGKELEFFYDESGNPYAFSYKASSTATPVTYYYLTNLQGDITGILDASGTTVAAYTYNAWGKLLSSSGDLASINPLRYRGYYYDAELEMYYLKSRYYDPEICRFINADDFASTGITIIGCNTFAYCNNNPVKYCDTSGHGPVAAFLTLLGLIMLATTALMSYHNAARALPESNDVADADPTTTTRNKLIKDQNGQTGGNFQYGFYPASHNACEPIAVHNAKILSGKDSSLSETMKDFISCGAMIGDGFFGSDPYAIGKVLKSSGLSYTKVTANQLSNEGIYIISFWNCNPPWNGLHTVAFEYYDGIYTTYNLFGDGYDSYLIPSDYFGDRFIIGYYIGG